MDELDNTAKTCVYIPPSNDAEAEPDQQHELQVAAYRLAWAKCLNRVRVILKELYAPVVSQVIESISHAYDDVLPGLPYPELPVVALTGTNSILLSEIRQHLHDPRQGRERSDDDSPILQVHLYPAECINVMNTMKAIVTGFVDQTPGRKRKATSLANFDINLLLAWFLAQDPSPKLIVILHEFEKFDSSVVQDVFYICSINIPRLPLSFVLVMSSPPSPSFLHTTYSRSTLALLRIHQIFSPTELIVMRQVINKTFFDPEFEPDIMLGAGALEYIVDFASRHTASLDALTTMLQLVHMKHFSQLQSVFVQNELLGSRTPAEAERSITSPDLRPLVDAVHWRILATPEDEAQVGIVTTPQSPAELLQCISSARTTLLRRVRRIRTAFTVARMAEHVAFGDLPQDFLAAKATEGRASRLDSLESFSAVLRGRTGPQVRYVCMAVRKLPASKLHELLRRLHGFWSTLENNATRRDEEDARTWIVQKVYDLPAAPDDEDSSMHDAITKQLASDVGDWLQQYLEERLLARLEDSILWDIWYTGSAPFPSELINPAPRSTVVAGLLRPHEFLRAHASMVGANIEPDLHTTGDKAIWELPDTSIAFRRYLEAGRMVNVFDWFESFAVVLDSQRRHLRRRIAGAKFPSSQRSNKGKQRAVDQAENSGSDEDGSGTDEEMDEEEEERWKVEVQARFIRSLHELDFMGFVKHTGRKADHVLRNFYDVPD